jgi:hypothetical protein
MNDETMDIYTEKGSLVTFDHPANGHVHEHQYATEHLKLGETYTVKNIIIEDWSSTVEFEEVPGKEFNTVMFSS